MGALNKESKTPFVILVLADLSGQPVRALPRLVERRLVTVTRASYPRLMRAIKPGFALAAGGSADAAEKYDVRFGEPDAFQSNAVMSRHPSDVGGKILNSAEYQALRASWLGLRWLLEATAELSNVKVQIWDITKRELLRDLQKAAGFDQTALFKRVYEEGLGTLGGDVIGVMATDYFLTASPDDCELAEKVSGVASTAAAPFLCGLRPGYFAVRRWDDLTGGFDPRWFIDSSTFFKWKGFSGNEDSRYAAMLLPRWREAPASGKGGGPDVGGAVWLHPCYLAAARIALAMNAAELADVAQRLFPDWQDSANTGRESGPASDCSGFAADIELEWEGSEDARAGLDRIGFHALTMAGLRRSDALETMASAARLADPSANVATALLTGRVWHRIYERARRLKHSDSADELISKIEQWAADTVPMDPEGRPLFRLGNAEGRNLRIPISWHPAAGDGRGYLSFGGLRLQSSRKPETPSQPSAKVVVVGELCPFERDEREYTIRQCDPCDESLPFTHTVTFQVPDWLNPGCVVEARFKPKIWEDLEPEQVSKLTPGLRSLAETLVTLADVGFHAHLDERRAGSLAELGARPEVLAALIGRLEGWRSLLRDPEHGAIDAETVLATLAGWGMEDEWYGATVLHSLSAFQDYAQRAKKSAGAISLDELRQRTEDIDRLVWQQVREIYRAPLFRHHERLCASAKWLAETIRGSGAVWAFGHQSGMWAERRFEGRLSSVLTDLWMPWGDCGLVVAVAAQYDPELLNETYEMLDLPRPSQRVLILPLDSAAPPVSIDDLEPSLAEGVLGAKKTIVIMAEGEFLLQPARLLRSSPNRGFEPCAGQIIEEELYASSAYQVAAAVVQAWSGNPCHASTLEPALNSFGLTCRLLGRALVVTQRS